MWGSYEFGLHNLLAAALPSIRLTGDPRRDLAQHLPTVRAYLCRQVSHGNDPFLNRELQMYLPIMADFDPDFVVNFLDADYIKSIVQTAVGLSPEQRLERMQLVSSWFFRNACLGTGVAMAVQVLGNNHFFHIGRASRIRQSTEAGIASRPKFSRCFTTSS